MVISYEMEFDPRLTVKGAVSLDVHQHLQKGGWARQGVTESAHSTLPKTVELREGCLSVGRR
jgi:hypothetical protein